MRARLGITSVTDTADDARIEACVQTASRLLDAYCGRRFWVSSSDETRYYTPTRSDRCEVDDLISVTTLKTDEDGDATFETTWTATTDYTLHPRNTALDVLPAPYRRIAVSYNGSYWFPVGVPDSVQIVGKFGYTAAPDMIAEACAIQAARIFRRKDSPDGVAGVTDFGAVRVPGGLDPDARVLADGYRRVSWA